MAGSPIGDWSPSRASLAEPVDNGDRVAREVVVGQKVTDFHFDEFEKFFVVDHVALVQEHDDVRNTDLTSEKDVFARLGHRTVSSGAHEDGAVHLGSTGNHVLHVVSVTRAVNVSIVTGGRFVFNVSGVDGDAAGLFFRSGVDLVISLGFATELLGRGSW